MHAGMNTHDLPEVAAPAHAQEPPFWNAEVEAIPFCQALKQRYPDILMELNELALSHKPFNDFPDYGLYSNGWEAFPVSVYEGEFNDFLPNAASIDMAATMRRIRQHLPVLSALVEPLEREGVLRNAFVSRLRPGSVIHPHRGWTPHYLRIHLGLLCDPGCRLTVGPETHAWKPGELLAFKDGGPYEHSVRHAGARERIVASFDLRLTYVARFIPGICGPWHAA